MQVHDEQNRFIEQMKWYKESSTTFNVHLIFICQNFVNYKFLRFAGPYFKRWALQLGNNRTLARDVPINSYY